MSEKSERYLELSNAVHRAYLGTLQQLPADDILDLLQDAYWIGLDLSEDWPWRKPGEFEEPPF
jgi:hypothetical protein